MSYLLRSFPSVAVGQVLCQSGIACPKAIDMVRSQKDNANGITFSPLELLEKLASLELGAAAEAAVCH
jgi:hypothetical protein